MSEFKLLMVTASTRGSETDPGVCLGMRFCDADRVTHIEDLLIKQIRSRYPKYRGMKPKQVRTELAFTVWAVPTEPKRGGWPIWLGDTGWYT